MRSPCLGLHHQVVWHTPANITSTHQTLRLVTAYAQGSLCSLASLLALRRRPALLAPPTPLKLRRGVALVGGPAPPLEHLGHATRELTFEARRNVGQRELRRHSSALCTPVAPSQRDDAKLHRAAHLAPVSTARSLIVRLRVRRSISSSWVVHSSCTVFSSALARSACSA